MLIYIHACVYLLYAHARCVHWYGKKKSRTCALLVVKVTFLGEKHQETSQPPDAINLNLNYENFCFQCKGTTFFSNMQIF